jgi:ABC-type nitrate/sulfonate/bicarbonate transport system ATPase subunit
MAVGGRAGMMNTKARTHADSADVVEITEVCKSFGGAAEVLGGISLTVRRGEMLSIVGPSGCGKTTLLRIVQGLETPSAGSVLVDGGHPRAAEIGFVFQQPLLFPWWTVQRNVEFGLRLKVRSGNGGGQAPAGRASRLIDLVGLGDFADYLPTAISGGMQQRANLARALAIDPAVLLLDEPFSAVDALTRERLQLVFDDLLARLSTTAILVTHDIREAAFLGTRVAVMGSAPGRITNVVDVEVPRPRGDDFQHSAELDEIARRIHHRLRES